MIFKYPIIHWYRQHTHKQIATLKQKIPILVEYIITVYGLLQKFGILEFLFIDFKSTLGNIWKKELDNKVLISCKRKHWEQRRIQDGTEKEIKTREAVPLRGQFEMYIKPLKQTSMMKGKLKHKIESLLVTIETKP